MPIDKLKATVKSVFLAEGDEDTGCDNLNTIRAMASDVGATDFDFQDGVCTLTVQGPENASELIEALEDEDCVEAYDVTHDADADPEDILELPEDTKFGFVIYLKEDEVTYKGVDVEDEDLEEATDDVKAAVFADLTKWFKSPDPNSWGSKAQIVDKIVAAHKISKAKASKLHTEWASQNDSDSLQECQMPSFVDDFGMAMSLDEVKKKIRVNFKGQKRVKMQCAPGFKYNAETKSCEKISGEALAKHRKATIRALVTRKAGGASLKKRAALRTKKAMKFRKAMGLK